MRRGGKGSLGHRGGEAYGGHNAQDLWDPDDDPSEWVINQDEDDELK
jgi:hypothetical protein